MLNLAWETKKALFDFNKTEDDIIWIGTRLYEIDKEKFWKLADVDYDNGPGTVEVAFNLIIVGDGWWLARDEDKGAEYWEYYELPQRPMRKAKIIGLFHKDNRDLRFGKPILECINGLL